MVATRKCGVVGKQTLLSTAEGILQDGLFGYQVVQNANSFDFIEAFFSQFHRSIGVLLVESDL